MVDVIRRIKKLLSKIETAAYRPKIPEIIAKSEDFRQNLSYMRRIMKNSYKASCATVESDTV